ncbi:EMBRYONIC FLOWER 2, CYTOKININ RESISTANT 1 [Hibiscus trionum]|uniref:EMBRYONIC FLOWER 2, CYTOKININ RESISTANT 1 n=1 Tax=Hibiscus trionum TaxID=183268 RepID=A0A9W7HDW2_HIBTR|nr:EMBRYONIC FLOWER 2, CYTOKININ RESISTANT 1 [Hibiscus trionum]
MHSCLLKLTCLNEDKCILIQNSSNSLLMVIISAEEIGAKEKSPYNSYTCSGISTSSLSHIIRRTLLQKRQFFHSHRAQPMAIDQVMSDRDSEDEVDDDVADFEDRRMLDDFVDVTKDEKQIMHLWNSFVRKQRVLADGHIAWACEAFSKLHGRDLVKAPALIWCWRLFMIKLWNHGVLDKIRIICFLFSPTVLESWNHE